MLYIKCDRLMEPSGTLRAERGESYQILNPTRGNCESACAQIRKLVFRDQRKRGLCISPLLEEDESPLNGAVPEIK